MKIGIVIMQCSKSRSSRYVGEVGKYFARKNEVHVFTHEHDGLDKRIFVHKVPAISRSFYAGEISFLAFATAIMKAQKFDVTMAQPTRYFSPDVGYMQFVYREWANRMKESSGKISFGNRMLLAMEKTNVKKAKKIITMSGVLKSEVMKNYGVPEENVEVVYSGVNCADFNPGNRKIFRSEARIRFGIDESDTVFLFAGNPFSRKGLEYAIRALPQIKEKVKLLILGKDSISPYMNLAKKLEVENRVIYAGFTSEIKKFFAASDAFLFPTLYEPFGLVITEAMASGLPVITSKAAGAAELIKDGKSGLLLDNPKDPGEIAGKVNHLIESNLFRKMGKAAREKAETFTWEKTARQMLSVLEEAAEMKRK